MKLNNNKATATQLVIKGDSIFKGNKFVLHSMSKAYEYKDGVRTDTVIGINYDCTEMTSFSRIRLRTQETTPVIDPEVLEESSEQVVIQVPLEQLILRPVKIEYGQVTFSITAPFVRLVKDGK